MSKTEKIVVSVAMGVLVFPLALVGLVIHFFFKHTKVSQHKNLLLISDTDLGLMRRLDELHLDDPFAGGRMLRELLLVEGYKVGRLHVRTLMKRMGIEAIYLGPNTSNPATGHKI